MPNPQPPSSGMPAVANREGKIVIQPNPSAHQQTGKQRMVMKFGDQEQIMIVEQQKDAPPAPGLVRAPVAKKAFPASAITAPPLASFNRPPVALASHASRMSTDTRETKLVVTKAASSNKYPGTASLPSHSITVTATIDGRCSVLYPPVGAQQQPAVIGEIIHGQRPESCGVQQPPNTGGISYSSKITPGTTVQIGNTNIMAFQQTKIGQSTLVKQNVIPSAQIDTNTTAVVLPSRSSTGVSTSGAITDLRLLTAPPTGLKVYRPIVTKANVASVVTNTLQGLTVTSSAVLPGGVPMERQLNSICSATVPVSGSVIVQPVVVSSASPFQQQPTILAATPGQVHNVVLPLGTTIKVMPTGMEQQPGLMQPISAPVMQQHTVVRPASPMTPSVSNISQQPAGNTVPTKVLVNPRPTVPVARSVVTASNMPPLYVPQNKTPIGSGLLKPISTVTSTASMVNRVQQPVLDPVHRALMEPGPNVPMTRIVQRRTSIGMNQKPSKTMTNNEQQLPAKHDALPPMPKLTPFTAPRLPVLQPPQVVPSDVSRAPRYVTMPASVLVPVVPQPTKKPPCTPVSVQSAFVPVGSAEAEGNSEDESSSSDVDPLVMDLEETSAHESAEGQQKEPNFAQTTDNNVTKDAERLQQNQPPTETEVIEILDSSFSSDTMAQMLEQDNAIAALLQSENLHPREVTPECVTVAPETKISPRLQKRAVSEHQPSLVIPARPPQGSAVSDMPAVRIRRRFSEFSTEHATRTIFPPLSAKDDAFKIIRVSNTQLHNMQLVAGSKDALLNDGQKVGDEEKIQHTGPSAKNLSLLCNETMEVSKSSQEVGKKKVGAGLAKGTKRKNPSKNLLADGELKKHAKHGSTIVGDKKRKKSRLTEETSEDCDATRSSSTSSESNVTIGKVEQSRIPSEPTGRKKASGKSRTEGKTASTGRSPPVPAPASESSYSMQDDSGTFSDSTTVAEHLRWHDGIGYLSESLIHFEFNKFGMVQPITAEEYDRHCSTNVYESMKKSIGKRPVKPTSLKLASSKRPRTAGDDVKYRCHSCSGRGRAVDFVTPEYCSIQCILTSSNATLHKYIQNSTHAIQQETLFMTDGKHMPMPKKAVNSTVPLHRNLENADVTQKDTAADIAADGAMAKKKPSLPKKHRKTTPSSATTPTTTTTSDDDSMSSLNLNSSSFLKRQEFRAFLPSSLDADSRTALPLEQPPQADVASGANNPASDTIADVANEDFEFNWQRYLTQMKVHAAPVRLFGPNPYPMLPGMTENMFRADMKLEAIDPENNSLFCVCTVVEVRGFRIKLHFDGYPVEYDFWVNADSVDIFPPGWCSSTNRPLQPPGNRKGHTFQWSRYLKETGGSVPDKSWFQHLNNTHEDNKFEIGMSLEADDLKKSGKLCVATVTDKMGDRVLVHFDGWDNRYDYWVSIYSNYIHPVNWHRDNNEKIASPPDWNKPFDWVKYLRYKSRNEARTLLPAGKALFRTRPPVCFKLGQRLEVVDRKQKHLIRPATVVAMDGYEVRLCFDGWPRYYAFWIEDDSPNLHPINWCARTKHPLEPPPNYMFETSTYDGTCELKFCLGRGNAKHPSKKFHDRPTECPYRRNNWMGEELKPLRISHDQVIDYVFHERDKPLDDIKPEVSSSSSGNSNSKSSIKESVPISLLKSVASIAPKIEKSVALRRPSVAIEAPMVSAPKRLKQDLEDVDVKIAPSSSTTTPPPSHDSSNDRDRVIGVKEDITTTTGTTIPAPEQDSVQESSINLAMPVILEYGPRLMHSYETWRRHSRYLDECTNRGDGLRKNPLHWTTDEMASYIEQLPGCGDCANRIRHEEITGKSFLSFTQDDLMNYLGIKIGPAIKIYNRIIRLRQLVTSKFIQL